MHTIMLSPEEGEELKRLYKEHANAAAEAARALADHGMNSKEFLEADRKTGQVWVRIRELLGNRDQHWMA